jgi:hypothetical protein
MSKKITETLIRNFIDGVPSKRDNTEVVREGNIYYLKLFGNKIAARINSKLWVSNAGWFSNTTKERLNGLPNVSIRQVKGEWYLNGNLWDGRPIFVGAC